MTQKIKLPTLPDQIISAIKGITFETNGCEFTIKDIVEVIGDANPEIVADYLSDKNQYNKFIRGKIPYHISSENESLYIYGNKKLQTKATRTILVNGTEKVKDVTDDDEVVLLKRLINEVLVIEELLKEIISKL